MKIFTLGRAATVEQKRLCENLGRRLRAKDGSKKWTTEEVLAYALQAGLAQLDNMPFPGERHATPFGALGVRPRTPAPTVSDGVWPEPKRGGR